MYERDIPERRNPHRGGRFALFFYEQVGSRYYLRFTGLALVLIVLLTVVPTSLILALFLWNRSSAPEEINVNIADPTPDGHVYPAIVPLPPPVTIPRPIQPSTMPKMPTPQMPSASAVNDNRPSTPSPTPTPTPARTPT